MQKRHYQLDSLNLEEDQFIHKKRKLNKIKILENTTFRKCTIFQTAKY